jgi:molecular chaperone HscB
MTSFDLNIAADFFTQLQLPQKQAIDLNELDRHYRELQARVHPDKHAGGSAMDQRLAMQWATRINEAYQTLKSPLARARYLLLLNDHDVQVESNTAMPEEFLLAQMELREAVEDAKVGAGGTAQRKLSLLATQVRNEMRSDQERLTELIDNAKDFSAAGALVRQLMFQQKLTDEIDDAVDELDEALN